MKKDVLASHATRLLFAALGAGLALTSVPALAQPSEEITITAPRVVREQVDRSPSTGAPIERVSLTRQVSYSGLDLRKQADVTVFETRVSDTAREACKQLDSLYPLLPPDKDCLANTTANGMEQAKQAIAAANR